MPFRAPLSSRVNVIVIPAILAKNSSLAVRNFKLRLDKSGMHYRRRFDHLLLPKRLVPRLALRSLTFIATVAKLSAQLTRNSAHSSSRKPRNTNALPSRTVCLSMGNTETDQQQAYQSQI